MKSISLQIQTVLFNNDSEMLLRSMQSIERAIQIYRSNGADITKVCLSYGDASPVCVLNDEAVDDIKKRFDGAFEFSYRFFGFNSGSAKGHNLLAENCETDYIILMNPDILFCPRFLVEAMLPFESGDGEVGIVEGRQVPLEHPKAYDEKTGEISWASGACSVVPTKLFHSVGGYDAASFFMYCDDVDLSWRIRMKGKKVIYQPRAMCFHAKQLDKQGGRKSSPEEQYYSAEADLFMAYKWKNGKALKKLLKKYKSGNNENRLKAIKEFYDRKKRRALPTPVVGANRVATFVDRYYTSHRYI